LATFGAPYAPISKYKVDPFVDTLDFRNPGFVGNTNGHSQRGYSCNTQTTNVNNKFGYKYVSLCAITCILTCNDLFKIISPEEYIF